MKIMMLIGVLIALTVSAEEKDAYWTQGAFYRQRRLTGFADSLAHTLALCDYHRDIPNLLDESDSWPHNRWSLSASLLDMKLQAAAFCGLKGSKLWFCNAHKGRFPISRGYTDALAAHRGIHDTLAAAVRNTQPDGIVVPSIGGRRPWHPSWRGEAFVGAGNWISGMAGAFGVPFCVRQDLTSDAVYALGGTETVDALSDAELETLFRHRVLVDGAAALALSKRGLERLLGVRAETRDFRYNSERNLKDGSVYPFGKHAETPWLTPLAAGTEELTHLCYTPYSGSPDVEKVAPGAVLATNALGGRVITTAFFATGCSWWEPSETEMRKDWFLRLLRRLGWRDFVLDADQDMVLLKRRVDARTALLGVFNTSFDPLPEVRISTPDPVASVVRVCSNGTWKSAAFRRVEGGIVVQAPLACANALFLHVTTLPTQMTSEMAAVVSVKSSADGTDQPCWFWAPEKAKTEAVPLLVTVHTWSGDYTDFIMYGIALERCRKLGWAFVGPNCRGPNKTPQACGSDLAVQDVVDAIEYAKRAVRVDASRVYMIGASGGGHLTLLMSGRHPKLFAATVACCPISDLARWHADSRLDHPGRSTRYADMLEAACGGIPAERSDEYRHRSPLTYLSRAREAGVPVYICTGIHDGWKGSVPVGHSVRAFNELADAKDRISEADIACLESTQTVPEALRFAGHDPFYAAKTPVLLRRDSQYARLTIFDAAHNGNYDAGFDFLARQAKGQEPDWTIPDQAVVGKTEDVAK